MTSEKQFGVCDDTFSVVLFLGAEEVEAVPSKWVFKDETDTADGCVKCWWPNKTMKARDFIKRKANVCKEDGGWDEWKVRVLGENFGKLFILNKRIRLWM